MCLIQRGIVLEYVRSLEKHQRGLSRSRHRLFSSRHDSTTAISTLRAIMRARHDIFKLAVDATVFEDGDIEPFA